MRTKSKRLKQRNSEISNSLSNLLHSTNKNTKTFNNPGNNNSKNRLRRNKRKIRSRKMKIVQRKRNRENSDILNNVPSSSNPNPIRDLLSANQESSSILNETEPLKSNSFNVFSKIFDGNKNHLIDFQNRTVRKKPDILQTKKLLKKSVIKLNNRDNRIETNTFVKNRRTVRLKNHQNNTNSIVLNHAEEIIVVDDEDDGQAISNCTNIHNNSANEANTYPSHNLTKIDPIDLDSECLDRHPINQKNDLNCPPQSSSNQSVIVISDSMEVDICNTDDNDRTPTSNIFFEDINNSNSLRRLPTPSYTLIEGFNQINRDSLEGTETTTLKDKISVDDSVIFVSESKADNFIPLSGIDANKHIQSYKKLMSSSPEKKNRHIESYHNVLNSPFENFKSKNTSTPKISVNKRLLNIKSSNNKIVKKKFSVQNRLLTAKEVAQNSKYNTNTYNPNKEPEIVSAKRMVIVDGSNVAFAHALSNGFSVKGLEICLEYFSKMGHEVKAVVPQFRLQKYKSTDPNKLEQLHKAGKIVFTPCKNLPGKSSTSYDDRFILQLAVEFDAAVVSNDNYRDLINENVAFKKIIENRVIGYSWCNDVFLLPKDPYGKNGPGLSVILNRV